MASEAETPEAETPEAETRRKDNWWGAAAVHVAAAYDDVEALKRLGAARGAAALGGAAPPLSDAPSGSAGGDEPTPDPPLDPCWAAASAHLNFSLSGLRPTHAAARAGATRALAHLLDVTPPVTDDTGAAAPFDATTSAGDDAPQGVAKKQKNCGMRASQSAKPRVPLPGPTLVADMHARLAKCKITSDTD